MLLKLALEKQVIVTVIAADVHTGIIVDESYAWYTAQPKQTRFEMRFISEEEAEAFCRTQIETHPDVEFQLFIDGEAHHRIVHKKWIGK